jgi:hypothetical protein
MWHKFLNITEQNVFIQNAINLPFLSQKSYRSSIHLTMITNKMRSTYARGLSAVYEYATKVNRTFIGINVGA